MQAQPIVDYNLLGLAPCRERQLRILLATIGMAACLLYVVCAITPSSYGAAFPLLGLEPQGLLAGVPRGIRSDEWMVFTPYVQIAVANGLDTVNANSPYHETLRSFQALPILDWGMLFKPYHWGFLFLPAANAYSLYFLFMSSSFLVGWSLFIRRLRVPSIAAFLVAATLYFSPFVQVWWTSNAGAFALAPWVALAWITFENRALRIAASAYALAVWMLSCAYPPFLYATLFAMAILIITFRRDTLNWARIFDATVAGAIALGVFIGYFHALIDVMQNTIYPGRRQSAGGGVEWAKLLAHLTPSITTYRYEPLKSFANSNACEIAVLSSLLPLYAATLLNYRNFRRWAADNQSSILLLAAGCTFLGSWIFLPFSTTLGKLTGLFMVPPARALLGLGLIVNIASAVVLLKCGAALSAGRLILLSALTALGTAVKLGYSSDGLHGLFSWMDALPYLCLLLLVGCRLALRSQGRQLFGVLFVALAANLISYGLFNPVQSAKPIFSVDRAKVTEFLGQAGGQKDSAGTWVVPGHFGALISGVGIPAVNHVLYYPQMVYFSNYFSHLPHDQLNSLFNRYAHISVGRGSQPRLIGADHVEIPMGVMLGQADSSSGEGAVIEMLAEMPAKQSRDIRLGHIDSLGPLKDSSLTLQGWFNASLDDRTRIRIWSSAQPVTATLAKMHRPDVATAVDPRLEYSGARLLITLPQGTRDLELCILVEEETVGTSTVRYPNGDTTCTKLSTQPI